MKTFVCSVLILICLAASGPSFAAEPADPQKFFLNLLESLKMNDAKSFIEAGDEEFQKKMTPELVEEVSRQLVPRMKKEYGVAYFGSLKKKDYETHIWKLTFEDSGDDLLTSVSVRDGKIVGFIIK